jgi:four helix bundle protein
MTIRSFRDLEAYQVSFALQQRIFVLSKKWPREEVYSLTDQVRRASRSIGANLAEAWGKRIYPAHFLAKLTDADGELQETLHWLDTAQACGYLSTDERDVLSAEADSVGRLLGGMMAKHQSFCVR